MCTTSLSYLWCSHLLTSLSLVPTTVSFSGSGTINSWFSSRLPPSDRALKLSLVRKTVSDTVKWNCVTFRWFLGLLAVTLRHCTSVINVVAFSAANFWRPRLFSSTNITCRNLSTRLECMPYFSVNKSIVVMNHNTVRCLQFCMETRTSYILDITDNS